MKRLACLVLAIVVAATGCTADTRPDARRTPSGSPSSQTPSGAPIPPAPARGACYRLTADELTQPTNDDQPVPCRRPHTAQTFFVGRLDLVVDGHAIAVDSRRVQRQVATACPRRFAAYVGGEPQQRDLSRLRVVWFSPTLEEADAGARWFRCDLVAFGKGDELHTSRGRVARQVLDDEPGRDRFGLCGTAAPGKPGHQRVLCSMSHSWRALTTIPLEGGRRYPGPVAVRGAGDSDCADLVREAEDFALTYTYGWEWPSRDQWRAGQHYGNCWMPVG